MTPIPPTIIRFVADRQPCWVCGRGNGLDVAYGLYSAFGVSHGTEDSTQRTVSQARTCGRCVLCRRARRLCAKVPLALPLGPVASEFDPARRAAPGADAAMVGRFSASGNTSL